MRLEDLKEGDKVLRKGYQDSIETIDRVTKTMIIIGACRYRRSTGYLVGDGGWRRSYLMVLTPKLEEDLRRKLVINKASGVLQKIGTLSLSYEEAEKVIDLYETIKSGREG